MARVAVAPFAWAGWRLRLPGGPEGGQYHGLLGDVGLMLPPRELHSGVYRGPAEVPPGRRANTVRAPFRRTRLLGDVTSGDGGDIGAGWGGTKGVRTWHPGIWVDENGNIHYSGEFDWTQAHGGSGTAPVSQPPPMPTIYTDGSGATAVVTQPPPADSPAPNENVVAWVAPPSSPAPAPTIAVSPSNFLPSQGLPLDTSASATSWFQQQTMISGYPNWEVALGAGALVLFLFSKYGKKK